MLWEVCGDNSLFSEIWASDKTFHLQNIAIDKVISMLENFWMTCFLSLYSAIMEILFLNRSDCSKIFC